MALFSQLPPGEQIKRWLSILTIMVIVIDCIAAGSLLLVTNLMNSIVSSNAQVLKSGDIASSIYRLHTGLYQYLAEYRPDTVELQKEVSTLQGTIKESFSDKDTVGLGTDLQEIDVTLEKYGKALQMLPKIGSTTNWKEVEELKNVAVGLGGQVETLAAEMKQHASDQIQQTAFRSRTVARTAMYVFIGFFLMSLGIIVLLFIWWREFQEMMLSL